MEKAALMYVIQAATLEWGVQGSSLGLLGASSGLGQAIGAFLFGRWSDIRGRRDGLLWALAITFMTGGLCAAAPSYASFVFLRFLANIGLGGALPCAFTLLTEFLPVPERARWIPYLYATYGAGRFLTASVAWALLASSWRCYMAAIALPSGAVLLLRSWIPETPHFLLTKGQRTEARALIEAAAIMNGKKSPVIPAHAELWKEELVRQKAFQTCAAFYSP